MSLLTTLALGATLAHAAPDDPSAQPDVNPADAPSAGAADTDVALTEGAVPPLPTGRLWHADWRWQSNLEKGVAGMDAGLWGVEGVGDVDADGYDDFIVRVASQDVTFFGISVVADIHLFRGGPAGPSWAPAWTTRAGTTAAVTGGDFNGDGYGDLAVLTNPFDFDDPDPSASIRVYHGGPLGLQRADAPSWSRALELPYVGLPDVAAGDFNGDGYDDLAVGLSDYDNPSVGASGSSDGQVRVFHGSHAGLRGLDKTLESWFEGALFGASMAVLGDVNLDGRDDLLIGAPGYSVLHANGGRAALYRGGTAGLGSPISTVTGDHEGDLLGYLVAAAGDVDGDGFPDALIVSGLADGLAGEGEVALHRGTGSTIQTTVSWFQEGNTEYGLVATGLGDVDGDGYDDIAVGRPSWTQDSTEQGKLSVYLGGTSGPSLHEDAWALGERAEDFLGSAVTHVGDVNGDGVADLMTNAPYFSSDEEWEGAVYWWAGFGRPSEGGGTTRDPLEDVTRDTTGGSEVTIAAPHEPGGGCSHAPVLPWLGLLALPLLGLRRRR